MQQVLSFSKYKFHLFFISDLFQFQNSESILAFDPSLYFNQNLYFSIQMCFQGSLANGIIFVILFQFMRNFFFVSRSIVSKAEFPGPFSSQPLLPWLSSPIFLLCFFYQMPLSFKISPGLIVTPGMKLSRLA